MHIGCIHLGITFPGKPNGQDSSSSSGKWGHLPFVDSLSK